VNKNGGCLKEKGTPTEKSNQSLDKREQKESNRQRMDDLTRKGRDEIVAEGLRF